MNNNRLEEKRNGGKKKELLYYIKNQAIRDITSAFCTLNFSIFYEVNILFCCGFSVGGSVFEFM